MCACRFVPESEEEERDVSDIAVAQLLAGSQVREVSQSLHREALASKQRVHGLVDGSRFVQQGKIIYLTQYSSAFFLASLVYSYYYIIMTSL